MPKVSTAVERIDGWKDIAGYLGKDVTTAIRWEKLSGLPIHRVPGSQRQAVFAWRHEIDAWLESGGSHGGNGHHLSAVAEEAPQEAVEGFPHPHVSPSRLWLREHAVTLGWTTVAVALLAGSGFAVHSLVAPRHIQLTGITQLTSDGTSKDGLVTDGEHLYFGEERDGRVVLSEVSVAGGPVRSIPTPLVDANPESISPDGKRLLVLGHEGEEEERALWMVPTDGGEPRRAGNILCHSAAWSPDGHRIAFATGKNIYITADEGATAQLVQEAAGVPQLLRWSWDGMRIRFESRDESTGQSSLWDLSGVGGSQAATLVPLHVSFNQEVSSVVMSDDAGRSFLDLGGPYDHRIWFLDKSWGLSGSHFTPVKLSDQLADVSALALDRSTRKLFVLSGATGGTELVRFNPATRNFKPFLAGITAEYVDFSSDQKRVAYIGSGSNSLWISRADGSEKRKVDFQAIEMELPRWSPDGRQIALMARLTGRPWRIFLVPAAGGKAVEASTGADNQGAPTWSPDGRWLMYGNVKCQELGTCAIHKIDLSTGKVFTLPGSEGMSTARWSPDGRYVAALYPQRQQVYAFDVAKARWRKLADGVNGNDLSWSADSRYIYASRPNGDKPEIFRVSLSDGKVESAVDLSAFSKLAGRVDTWFGLAPDGSIIFMRWLEQTEIYALSYQER